jgi:hypothetical protein
MYHRIGQLCRRTKGKKLEGDKLVNREKYMKNNEERGAEKNNKKKRVGLEDFSDIHQGEGRYFVLFSENKKKQLSTSSRRRPIYIIVILYNIYC